MMTIKPRSMRARMTAQFALFAALLMLGGGTVLQWREVRRAERQTRELLDVAAQRARDESGGDNKKSRSLLEAVRTDSNEIAESDLVLLVIQNNRVVWRSPGRVPAWPTWGAD